MEQKTDTDYENLKENREKGFTLMEMIVVLVIMAILAAIMIPSMVGWIDKAKQSQVLIQARSAYMASQTAVLERYAQGEVLDDITADELEEVEELVDLEGNIKSFEIDTDSGMIIEFVYTEDGYTATYQGADGGSEAGWTVSRD